MPFFRIVLKVFRGRRRSRAGDGFLRLEARGSVAQCFALSLLRRGALLSYRIKSFRERRQSRSEDGFLRLEARGFAVQCAALPRLWFGTQSNVVFFPPLCHRPRRTKGVNLASPLNPIPPEAREVPPLSDFKKCPKHVLF